MVNKHDVKIYFLKKDHLERIIYRMPKCKECKLNIRERDLLKLFREEKGYITLCYNLVENSDGK